MSVKNRDNKNRFRSKTVGFRMSPEEVAQLDVFVKLSGLNKQDYLIKRVFEKEIIVNGNPRVFKALKNQLQSVYSELCRLETVNAENDELVELICYIAKILNGFKGDEQ